MPRHAYDSLIVTCFNPVTFDLSDPLALRKAVEHLRTLEGGKFIGLLAEVSVAAGRFKLRASAFLQLKQIEGKTPAEVWLALDREVDRQVRHFFMISISVYGRP
ncbi:MAG: hypothetical protein WKF34_07110 [Pyrinomonadaceae bacterium]